MKGFLDNLSKFIGIPPEPEIADDFESEPVEQAAHHHFEPSAERFPRLAAIQVVKPRMTEDGFRGYSIRHYADLLKEQNALILDITEVAEGRIELAKRLIDFLAGVTLALGGTSREINPNMFLFAPSNFLVGGDAVRMSDDYE
ncbi:MAG: cell division protein SepF [bacterium]|jgi:FtsZ-interacting cell division protein YlmF